jgi:hypothetical protein
MRTFNFTSDFCIEFFYRGNQTSRGTFFDINGKGTLTYTGSTDKWELTGTGSQLYGTVGIGKISNTRYAQNILILNNTSWNHIALTKAGNIYRLFVNGLLVIQLQSAVTFGSTTDDLVIGNNQAQTLPMSGGYSQIRILEQATYTREFWPFTKPLLTTLGTQWFESDAHIAIDGSGSMLTKHGLITSSQLANTEQSLDGLVLKSTSPNDLVVTTTQPRPGSTGFTINLSLYLAQALPASGDANIFTLYSSTVSASQRLVLQLAYGNTYHSGYSGLTNNEGGLVITNGSNVSTVIPITRSVFAVNTRLDIVVSYDPSGLTYVLINSVLRGISKYSIQVVPDTVEKLVTGQVLTYFNRYQLYPRYSAISLVFSDLVINGSSSIPDTAPVQYTVSATLATGTYVVYGFTAWSIIAGNVYATINANGLLTPVDVVSAQNVTIQAATTINGTTLTRTKVVTIS